MVVYYCAYSMNDCEIQISNSFSVSAIFPLNEAQLSKMSRRKVWYKIFPNFTAFSGFSSEFLCRTHVLDPRQFPFPTTRTLIGPFSLINRTSMMHRRRHRSCIKLRILPKIRFRCHPFRHHLRHHPFRKLPIRRIVLSRNL